MGVWLRSRDQMAKWGIAHEKFSLSEESTYEQMQGENHDYCFFDSHGIVHIEFVPPGQTVNHTFYKDVLEWLRKWVQRVRRDIADNWVLQYDNTPAHTVLSIWEFLANKIIPILPHPPYSPDLAPCNFYLFPKLKLKLTGHHFDGKHTKNCNRWAKHTYGKWLPVLLWSVDKTEPLCNFPRVILWRR